MGYMISEGRVFWTAREVLLERLEVAVFGDEKSASVLNS
jgi:hypothetical protein